MQPINFFDDSEDAPRSRDEVRLNELGLYVYEDRRRVAVGFNLTPFLERPSIEVTITNDHGAQAGSLTVIEALEANFHLTMHLRDDPRTDTYRVEAVVYYPAEDERSVVDRITGTFDASREGETIIRPDANQ